MVISREPGCFLIGEDRAVLFLPGFDASFSPLLVKVALAVIGQTVPEPLLRTSSADRQQSLRLRPAEEAPPPPPRRSSHG